MGVEWDNVRINSRGKWQLWLLSDKNFYLSSVVIHKFQNKNESLEERSRSMQNDNSLFKGG